MKKNIFALLTLTAVLSLNAHATPCGEFIYNKKGMLRHYQWAPNTASENTKKNGIASSTIYPSTENTTAAVDPGVSTGASTGTTQSWSSYGPCSFVAQFKHASFRSKYIEENFDEIRKQAAVGNGGHLDSIAMMSNCSPQSGAKLGALLQKNYPTVYGFSDAQAVEFANYVDQLIHADFELSQQCSGT